MSGVIEATERQEIAYTRQADWFDPADHPNAHVTIVGVGGLGSPAALALAKLGIPKLTLIDPDVVERHNLPNQLFPIHTTGEYKIDAAADVIREFTPTEVIAHQVRIEQTGWEADDPHSFNNPGRPHGLVVTGLDNMEARANLWHTQLKHNMYVPRVFDARMGGQQLLLYSVNPCDDEDIAYYESKLYTDAEARETPCTAAAVIDVGFMMAALITRAVRKHYGGEPVDRMTYIDEDRLILGKE